MTLPLRPGDPVRLGDFEITGRLGAGGMGTVFLGHDPGGRPVAVKVLRSELAWNDELRGRFRSEVNRIRQVPSFCTAAILAADPDHDPPYLVVEFVDGPSLTEAVRAGAGGLGRDEAQSLAVGLAAALAAIHGAGVIHRDLKPSNVLLARGGLKVIDFGIARPVELTSHHTRTDQMLGTVEYMAPERFESSRTIGPAADVFAWGVVVAFAVTGRTPFAAGSAPATAMRIVSQPPDLSGLAGPLRDLVGQALAKDPAHRPTARALLDHLIGAGDSAGSGSEKGGEVKRAPRPPAPVSLEQRGPRRLFVFLLVVTGLLGSILTAAVFWILEDLMGL